jgi:TonB family protein
MISAMKVSAIQSDFVGRVIDGRFSLIQWLGGSGRSSVFLTELPGEPLQKAAIKLVPADPAVVAHLAFAANASRAHSHLVRVLQSGRCEIDRATFEFVVMEYADEVLSEILPMRALAPEEVKEMLAPILDSLSDLHGHGLVHGRLKPSNVLVVNDELKLSSDSLQLAGATADLTPALSVYDAPERAEGTLTFASDIWSLGALMVEALTQRTPNWDRSTQRDVQISGNIPQPFAAIAAACLRVDPARRATLNDIRGRLGLLTQVTEVKPPAAEPTPPTPKPRVKPEPSSKAQVPQQPAAQAKAAPKVEQKDTSRAPYEPARQAQSKQTARIDPMYQAQVEPPLAPRGLSRFDEERDSRRKPRGGVVLVLALILVAVAAFLWNRSHGTLPATKSNDQPPAQSSKKAPVVRESRPQTPPAAQVTPEPAQELPPLASAPPASALPAAAAAPAESNAGSAEGAVAQRVMPEPLPAAMRTIHGRVNVLIHLNVGPTGEVIDARYESMGPSKYFAEVAMKAARQWKFTPVKVNGQPVASIWTLHFVFTSENTEVTPAQAAP